MTRMQLFRQLRSARNAAALPPPRTDFVELGRRFSTVTKTSDRDDAADESYLLRVWSGQGRLDWEKLLKKPLVVVLGEQGSGKSWEIEHQASMLAAAGQFSFFIRLEDLIAQPLTGALGPAAASYDDWKASRESATFFLDSVDESKLNGAEDFYSALKHFHEALPNDFAVRAHIILSSRVSEWHPESDGARVRDYFGVAGRQEINDSEDDETSSTRHGEDGLLVVQINPLEREQVATLARTKGYARVDDFFAALDHAHAWEFARRPIDVVALADFWQQQNRIGTLTELIEFDLVRNLRERRAKVGDMLSDGDARAGAEALAAGAVFCGQPNIKVSDVNVEGTGLDGQLSVPANFTRDQFDALLARPVFDGASFGRVRFHHRRVREYLAACWVGKRMAAGCSLDELEALFFDHIGGRRVIRASRAAAAAWLCAGGERHNDAIRGWVLESAPDLNLRYGDPHALPLEFKQALLAKLVESARTRGNLWLETDQDALGRLADPGLVPQIEAIIRDRQLASDLRASMLEIVRHSRLAVCLPTVLDLVVSTDEPDDLKAYAVAALRELNNPASLIRLAQIAPALPRVATTLTDLLLDALFPSRLSVDEFVALLRKTWDRNRRRPDLHWQIKTHLEERLQPGQAGLLLDRLVALLRTEPYFPAELGEPAVSQEFAWLRPLVAVTLVALLKKPTLTPEEIANAGAGLTLVGSLRERHAVTGEEQLDVQKLTLAHPAVRREFFWAAVHRRRPQGLHTVDHPLDIFSRYDQLLAPASADVAWLVQDLATLHDEADREVALLHAMHWCNDTGRPLRLRWRIRRAVGSHPKIRDMLRELDRAGRILPLKRYYFRLQRNYWERRRQGERAYGWVLGCIRKIRSRYFLWKNLRRIARGELFGTVFQLVNGADPENRSYWTVSRWTALDQEWGAAVVTATRTACKGFWRTFRPELSHESADPSRIPNGIIVGLTGLQAAWADNELDFSALTNDEVKLATRYALREINGYPPWFNGLAENRPSPVAEIFIECIAAEWNAPDDQQRRRETLERLASKAEPDLPAIRSALLARLQDGDPSGRALGLILGYLVHTSAPPLDELALLARARLANAATTTEAAAQWFAIWIQGDPSVALAAWEAHVRSRADADTVMVLAGSSLQDRDFNSRLHLAGAQHLTVPALRQLLPVLFVHIKPADDIHRGGGGTYTPGARDYAQEFRGGMLRVLTDATDPAAADALLELSGLSVFAAQRDWLLHLRDENLSRQADQQRWRAEDVRQFEQEQETDPQSDRDLYRILLKRVSDVKNDVERSDGGLRTHLRAGDIEARLRIWLAQELARRSRRRYTVPQEAVIDHNQRPDIRLENPRTDPVSIEIKWAQDWSFNELMAALEHQLLGQYLRAHNSRHGVLVLGMHDGGRQGWDPPAGGRLRFHELLVSLQAKALELERMHSEVKRLSVVGIDFRNPVP